MGPYVSQPGHTGWINRPTDKSETEAGLAHNRARVGDTEQLCDI